MKKLLRDYFEHYASSLEGDCNALFSAISETEWSPGNFTFYTAVSVISSLRIEGEKMEIDSYLKHKIQNIDYLPDLTEKPNDLYKAYEFARDNELNPANLLKAHTISTTHLLPENLRGTIRNGNMLIMDQNTGRIQFEAAGSFIVEREYLMLWEDINHMLREEMTLTEVLYFASLIHFTLVKIHPFNDGNGRSARLLEKWFLASKLGKKAWFIRSESYYYKNLEEYYFNLARTGLFYEETDYSKAVPFLTMLPSALKNSNG